MLFITKIIKTKAINNCGKFKVFLDITAKKSNFFLSDFQLIKSKNQPTIWVFTVYFT